MSNIYLLEPHTNGKVILHTTQGDISIELWPKEAPKACRNFIQLCMEGYYNDTIFHRIVAGFIIQGGDPEGTGLGGESSFEGGKPFADEFHSRLRFVRRGLVAMANSGTPNDNKSQFFITLDSTQELQNKHTIFGKIAGDTIFNVLKIGGLEVDDNERPLYPPKITGCTIVVNPFDDIVPRISRQEREAARLRELEAQKKPEKQKKLKKNVALLSFADDETELTMDHDDDGENSNSIVKKKMLSSHDLLEDDPTLSREVDTTLVSEDQYQEAGDAKDRRKNRITEGIHQRDETHLNQKSRDMEGGEEEEDQESANAFDQRMRDQIREKYRKAKLAKESSTGSAPSLSSSSPAPTTTAARINDEPPIVAPLSEAERRRQEIQELESDIRKMHNRGDDPSKADSTIKKPKVSLLQLEREQYKTRGESKKGAAVAAVSARGASSRSKAVLEAERERELMEKLSAFETKVFSSAREPEPNPAPKRNEAPPCEIHGIPSCESCQDTITKKQKKGKEAKSEGGKDDSDEEEEGQHDSDSDNDIGWMQHKLVFEKDLKGKEVSLSAKRDDVNDYIVIDPLNKAAATTAALAVEQQMRIDKKLKRDGQVPQDRHAQGGRVYSSSSSSRLDRPYDRSSSSSSRRDDSRKSGYDRDDRHGRDSRGDRDSRDNRGDRDNRDSRDRDRRW